eukprot:149844_1
MKDLMNFVLFYRLWIFSSCNIHLFWFGMIVLRNKAIKFYLFENITHKNISCPSHISVAVITINYEPDISTKKRVTHGMEIITALGAEQYSAYCAKVHSNTQVFYNMLDICYKGYIGYV